MKLSALALAAALSLSASVAFSQEANVADMMSGMNMLETNAAMAFKKYGIDANPMNLTLGQLALISRTLNDPDADTEGNSVKSTLSFIVGM